MIIYFIIYFESKVPKIPIIILVLAQVQLFDLKQLYLKQTILTYLTE